MVAAPPPRVNASACKAEAAVGEGSAPTRACARLLARWPLFGAIAPLLEAWPADCSDGIDALNALLATIDAPPRTRSGYPIRFTRAPPSSAGYEARIHATGEVPTRSDNWHDFFNALVWMRFPRTKAELNALHLEEMRRARGGTGRGALRDAATQFDESGIVVLSSDASLFELLLARSWHELFWLRRADVAASMRFLVFGHALYDALRAPFYRMCGRAALLHAAAEIIAADAARQCRHADAMLAARFVARTFYPRPKSLMAVPLLGIPGMCPDNECAHYYADTLQFRPPPAAS